jgi:hypothetical protein
MCFSPETPCFTLVFTRHLRQGSHSAADHCRPWTVCHETGPILFDDLPISIVMMMMFLSKIVIFPLKIVMFLLKMVMFLLNMMIFLLNFMIVLLNMMIIPLQIVMFLLKIVIFQLNMVIFLLNMMNFLLKMVNVRLNMVNFHSSVSLPGANPGWNSCHEPVSLYLVDKPFCHKPVSTHHFIMTLMYIDTWCLHKAMVKISRNHWKQRNPSDFTKTLEAIALVPLVPLLPPWFHWFQASFGEPY